MTRLFLFASMALALSYKAQAQIRECSFGSYETPSEGRLDVEGYTVDGLVNRYKPAREVVYGQQYLSTQWVLMATIDRDFNADGKIVRERRQDSIQAKTMLWLYNQYGHLTTLLDSGYSSRFDTVAKVYYEYTGTGTIISASVYRRSFLWAPGADDEHVRGYTFQYQGARLARVTSRMTGSQAIFGRDSLSQLITSASSNGPGCRGIRMDSLQLAQEPDPYSYFLRPELEVIARYPNLGFQMALSQCGTQLPLGYMNRGSGAERLTMAETHTYCYPARAWSVDSASKRTYFLAQPGDRDNGRGRSYTTNRNPQGDITRAELDNYFHFSPPINGSSAYINHFKHTWTLTYGGQNRLIEVLVEGGVGSNWAISPPYVRYRRVFSDRPVANAKYRAQNLHLHPNPANHHLQVSLLADGPQPYTIYNLHGQLLLAGWVTHNGQVSVAALPQGTYVMQAGGARQRFAISR